MWLLSAYWGEPANVAADLLVGIHQGYENTVDICWLVQVQGVDNVTLNTELTNAQIACGLQHTTETSTARQLST